MAALNSGDEGWSTEDWCESFEEELEVEEELEGDLLRERTAWRASVGVVLEGEELIVSVGSLLGLEFFLRPESMCKTLERFLVGLTDTG